ncbi:MAG: TRAP transporter large permease [Rhodobacteraceae bacterium]|nr:TRAP transporter large permease [Paracoccaceae bacterium]
MEPLTIGLLGCGALLVLVVLGLEVYIAAALVGIGGLMAMRGWSVGAAISGLTPHAEIIHYGLSVIPMFILLGYFAQRANIIGEAFHAFRIWLGWLPGGLAVATIFAAAGFSAVSGSSTATAAVFSRVAIPEMLNSGYAKSLAAGTVAASGTLAALIPPSAILVLYALIVEESVGRLLIAAVVPGLLTALAYALVPIIWALLYPKSSPPTKPVMPDGSSITWGDRFLAIRGMASIAGTVVLILSGIYFGWMTPTESGAVGAFLILIIAILRKQMTMQGFREALRETVSVSVMIFSIVWGIIIFVRFLGYAGLPEELSNWIGGIDAPRIVILLGILLIYLLLGMFMDAIGMMMLTLPFVYPTIIMLGYDPIWFGIVLVKMVEIGLMTPPIGMNCFIVAAARDDIPLQTVFKGVTPFFLADGFIIALLILAPDIVTLL